MQFALLVGVVTALREGGVRHALAQGTALAATRTIPGLFLPWDHDADVYFDRPRSKNMTATFDASIKAQGFTFDAFDRDYKSIGTPRGGLVRVDANNVFYERHAARFGWYNESAFRTYTHELDWNRDEGKSDEWIEDARGKIYVDLYPKPVKPAPYPILISSHGIVHEFSVQQCDAIEEYFNRFWKMKADDIWKVYPPHIPEAQFKFLGYEPERRCTTFHHQ